jgi:hypothetical protein
MATRIKPKTKELYRKDFYVWALEQADRLRAKRFDTLDLDNLIEEVEGLADVQRSAVLNNARAIMEHLLKLEHCPATDPRKGWRASVVEHRARLEVELTPRLRQIVDEERPRIYGIARRAAEVSLRDHGESAAAAALPPTCPYTLDQISGDWLP